MILAVAFVIVHVVRLFTPVHASYSPVQKALE